VPHTQPSAPPRRPSSLLAPLHLLVLVVAALGCSSSSSGTEKTDRLATSRQALTTLDTRPGNNSLTLEQGISWGQIITASAGDSVLTSYGFDLYPNFPSTLILRGEVYAWDGFWPVGPRLYQSAPMSASGIPRQTITFDTGGIGLEPGTQYLLAATTSRDPGTGSGAFDITSPAPYGGGLFAYSRGNAPESDLWGRISDTNAAFTATFVSPGPSTTTLVSSKEPSVAGESITFTATVSGAAGTARGKVTFKDGAAPLGIVTLDGTGIAKLTTSALPVGAHDITAAYAGAGVYAASTSSPLAQTVGKATTTTALRSSSNPTLVGGSTTFTATVTIVSPGTGTASGTVTFNEGARTLGTSTLDASGVATLATSGLSAGPHDVVAVYGGDGSFAESTSPAIAQVVIKDGAMLELTSSLTPSTYGRLVTLTAAVTGSLGTPAGSVTFVDGAEVLGTVALDPTGHATFSTKSLGAGTHSLEAQYGGSGTYATATGTASHVIAKASSVTTLVTSLNPSTVGASVTFTATVAAAVAGLSGEVELFDGASSLGVIALVDGTASLSTKTLTRGPHEITATYKGEANFATSAAPSLTETVDAAPSVSPPAVPSPQSDGDAAMPAQSPSAPCATPTSDGSCGCRVTARYSTRSGAFAALAASVALLARRRRRRRRP
jgi:hypothetical protein